VCEEDDVYVCVYDHEAIDQSSTSNKSRWHSIYNNNNNDNTRGIV